MRVGVDEVGRGPWAGPLVVGAVVLGDTVIPGLTDSKKLTHGARVRLSEQITRSAAAYGLGWVHPDELDAVGLSESLRRATVRALESITVPYDEIFIDGTVNFLKNDHTNAPVTVLAKADLLIPEVSAASIVAKVARDTYMSEQAASYPEYGFESHKGYGTAVHKQALVSHGLTPLHRQSFRPIAQIASTQTSKAIGDTAESRIADLLRTSGYDIIERNWKTRWCEIDIVAHKDGVYYVIEVKYRRSNAFGGGTAALDVAKIRQLQRAAKFYVARHPQVKELRLVGVSLDKSGSLEWFGIGE